MAKQRRPTSSREKEAKKPPVVQPSAKEPVPLIPPVPPVPPFPIHHRVFAKPRVTGQVNIRHTPTGNQKFQPLPRPTGVPPYHLSLETVVSADIIQAITASGQMVFHIVGDTGGIKDSLPQQVVDEHMEGQFEGVAPEETPTFFYHLGDVVYFNGDASEYYGQFYHPYMNYKAPILGIPGNHDGDPNPGVQPVPASLAAFVENFCAPAPLLTKEAQDAPREAMTQPNVYWALETSLARFIGLYTNVPNGGMLDDYQKAWLVSELKGAPADQALIVCMHHPIYSLDTHHSGSKYMAEVLDAAIQSSGRTPDIVFAGHVHNYQRFTRQLDGGSQIPYIVAGSGGYHSFHYLPKASDGGRIQTPFATPENGVTLESYCEGRHGFMRVTVTKDTLKGEYFSVPTERESPTDPAKLEDSFLLDLRGHTVS